MTDLNSPARVKNYLTREVPGTGGVLRMREEDFFVEEIPAYDPCGEGEHLYLLVEKKNLSTGHLVRLIAKHYGVARTAVGVAGLKDRRAVTRQMVSVHLPGARKAQRALAGGGAGPGAELAPFETAGAHVLWSDWHTNKLRQGHLKGNRFIIRIRDVEPAKVVHAHRSLMMLSVRGVPNRFGPQRFGHLQHNHLVGRALLKFDHEAAVRELLGPRQGMDEGDGMGGLGEAEGGAGAGGLGGGWGAQRAAREAFARGEYQAAMELLPRAAHTERRVLDRLHRGGTARDAVRAIEALDYLFFLHAAQSAVFNTVLEKRLSAGTFDRLLEGDLAFRHDNGAVFAVDGAVLAEARTPERLAKFEVSPSGPMWAAGMTRAGGAVDEAEVAALAEWGLTPEDLERYAARAGRGEGALAGARRALRVPLMYPDIESGVDEHGSYIKCVFELPRGSFATAVMEEIMKSGVGGEEEE